MLLSSSSMHALFPMQCIQYIAQRLAVTFSVTILYFPRLTTQLYSCHFEYIVETCRASQVVHLSVSYATSPYRGAGDMDMVVEQHVRFAPSCFCIGFLPDPLLERVGGGCTSFAKTTEFDRDNI